MCVSVSFSMGRRCCPLQWAGKDVFDDVRKQAEHDGLVPGPLLRTSRTAEVPPSSLVRTRSMWSEMFFNKNYYLNYFGRQNEWKICQVAMNGVVRPRESLAKSIWIQRSNKLKQTNWEISLLLSFIFYLWINSSLWRE